MIITAKSLRSVLLACLGCIAFASFAIDQPNNSIGVEMNDGSRLILFLDRMPTIVYHDNEIVFRDINNSTSVHFSDVKSYRPEFNDPSGIISAETGNTRVFISGGDITVETAEEATVTVYNSAGQTVTSATVTPGERFTIGGDSCPAGVYLVKINDRTFKIAKP